MSVPPPSFSIREVARRTGIPESTLRYYRSVFSELIPTLGAGRERRHPEEALPAFLLIARLFAAGESRGAVRRELQQAQGAPGHELVDSEGGRAEAVPATAEERRYEITLAQGGGLRRHELEGLVGAMLVRDRELAAMHRDLIDLVGKLINVVGSLAAEGGARVARPSAWEPTLAPPAVPAPAQPPPGDASQGLEVERLRDSLARERETVERLRRARLELEQRLARLERDLGEGDRKR
jgi:DNA-binding transcriptional MerR regulator